MYDGGNYERSQTCDILRSLLRSLRPTWTHTSSGQCSQRINGQRRLRVLGQRSPWLQQILEDVDKEADLLFVRSENVLVNGRLTFVSFVRIIHVTGYLQLQKVILPLSQTERECKKLELKLGFRNRRSG